MADPAAVAAHHARIRTARIKYAEAYNAICAAREALGSLLCGVARGDRVTFVPDKTTGQERLAFVTKVSVGDDTTSSPEDVRIQLLPLPLTAPMRGWVVPGTTPLTKVPRPEPADAPT